MDFKQLQQFMVLAQTLHFANAAKRCHMTASALTRSMQRLEQELGVSLFWRNARQVQLTVQGQQFMVFAEQALEQYLHIKQSLNAQQATIQGSLSLFSSVTASYSLLSPLLKEYRRLYPKVDVRVHTGDQAEAIRRIIEGSEDVAIAAKQEVMPKSVDFYGLVQSPLVLVVAKGVVHFSDSLERFELQAESALASVPLILAEQGLTREALIDFCQKHQVKPHIYAEISGHEAILSMVALGEGVGLLPEIVIEHSPLRSKIRRLRYGVNLPSFDIGICTRSQNRQNAAVEAFWQLAQTQYFKG